MQRTKEDVYALIQKGERLHAECKEAFGALPDALNFNHQQPKHKEVCQT